MFLQLKLLAILLLVIDLSDERSGLSLVCKLILFLISEYVICICNFTHLFFDDSKFGFKLSHGSTLVQSGAPLLHQTVKYFILVLAQSLHLLLVFSSGYDARLKHQLQRSFQFFLFLLGLEIDDLLRYFLFTFVLSNLKTSLGKLLDDLITFRVDFISNRL